MPYDPASHANAPQQAPEAPKKKKVTGRSRLGTLTPDEQFVRDGLKRPAPGK